MKNMLILLCFIVALNAGIAIADKGEHEARLENRDFSSAAKQYGNQNFGPYAKFMGCKIKTHSNVCRFEYVQGSKKESVVVCIDGKCMQTE